jgi:hypothetical protein
MSGEEAWTEVLTTHTATLLNLPSKCAPLDDNDNSDENDDDNDDDDDDDDNDDDYDNDDDHENDSDDVHEDDYCQVKTIAETVASTRRSFDSG